MQSALLATYILKGNTINGTLLDRLVKTGVNPLKLILDKPSSSLDCDINKEEGGLIDSLRFLLHNKKYNKASSEEHILFTLLTKAF